MPYFIDETVLSHQMNYEENCNLSFQQIKNLLFQTVNFFLYLPQMINGLLKIPLFIPTAPSISVSIIYAFIALNKSMYITELYAFFRIIQTILWQLVLMPYALRRHHKKFVYHLFLSQVP